MQDIKGFVMAIKFNKIKVFNFLLAKSYNIHLTG